MKEKSQSGGEKKEDDIYIIIEDNGMGMRKEVLENIPKDNNKVPKHGSGVGADQCAFQNSADVWWSNMAWRYIVNRMRDQGCYPYTGNSIYKGECGTIGDAEIYTWEGCR